MENKNSKIVAIVSETRDYGYFKKLKQNRAVTEDRVKRLVESYSEKELLNPIIINEKHEIVEGQGRYEALKRLGRPVPYIIVKGAGIDDCRRLNVHNTKWGCMDWIDSHAQNDDEAISGNYKRLKECMTKYGLSAVRCLTLSNHSHGNGSSRRITSGSLVFSESDIDAVGTAYKYGNRVIDALCMNYRSTNEVFWRAIRVALDTDGFDQERFIRNCRAKRSSFSQMSTIGDMLREFTRIYNYRSRDQLYFEDYMRDKGHNRRNYEKTKKDIADVSTIGC